MKPTFRTRTLILALSSLGLITMQAPSFAGETVFNLTAGVTTLTMPDGDEITMWGFGLEGGPITVPGPELAVPPGDSLRINLTNTLPDPNPVSVVIPGQAMPLDGVNPGPQVTRNQDGRIRSFTHETPNGQTAAYLWPAIKPGTYLYQSGTHQAVQVQMGLYGAVKNDAAPGEAYPGKSYVNEITYLFSEIDPLLHAAVAAGSYGGPLYPSTINYVPKYFLINGQPYSDPPPPPTYVPTHQTLLIRFLNSGLQTHVPVILGMDMELVAEDGNLYPYPKTQYSVPLFAGKTTDALMTPSRVDTYPVFDRALGLTNGTAGAGGMLTYVATGDVVTFTTQPVSQTVRVGTPVSFSAAITGTGPFGYQWRKDSQDIPGATDLTYNIAAAALTDAGSYTLVVTSTLGSFSSATAVLTVADLQLTSPNGGESWPLGSTQTVTWNGPGIGPSIKLKLWRNGVFTGYFLTGIEDNDGSYTWKIPGTLTEGAGYRIQVYTPDYSFSDFSDADFDLAPNPLGPNPLVLTSPNDGETWPLASTQTITWNGPNAGPSIKLRLWHNGTFTGYYLTGIEDNDGSYTWKIPGTLTADTGYRIQVYTPDYTYSDFSDADFTLTPDPLGPNPLTLTSPNGGESWAVGGIQTITWNGPGVGPYVKLRLWRNGVFTGYYLTGNEANDGSYTWYIPSTLAPDTTYKIQVYTPDYTYSDFSDAPFTVTANPLRLIRPNGGEAWALGSTHSVDWESGPAAGPNVKLKLWLNGVFTGYYLTGIEPNDGGYTWKIPSTLAPVSGYMIQVYTPDYSFSDFSDSAFSLVP